MKRSGGTRFVVAIVAALALVGSGCGSDKKTTSSASGPASGTSGDTPSLLGELNSAAGEPVKVGLITTGVGQGFDTAIDVPVAKATAKWINEYRGGIGGRPIEIVTCEDKQDPGVAADCGNEMVQQDVVAVFYGASGQYEASWRVLNEAGVPTFILAVGSQTAAKDATNTFILNNSLATTIDGPLSLAKKRGSKIVSVIAVDVPAATVNYTQGAGPQKFKDAGIELDLIPVPLGTPDMTVQTQELVKKNPDGVVNILGTDAFCIAALSGLRSAGYTGAISANEACITDNTRKAIPLDYLKGLRIVVQVPFNDPENQSTKLFNAVMDKYADGKVSDRKDPEAGFSFLALVGLDVATAGLQGDVTHASIIAAAKSMEWSELPASGGRHIRCNSKADPQQPAVCSNAVLNGVLDSNGVIASYEALNDEEIPD